MSWRLTGHKPYTDSKLLESDVMAQAYLAPASNSMLRRVEFRRRAAWKVPPSLIPRQLTASPMLVFPRRVEHAFDVAVQRSHHTYPRKHGWPVMFRNQY
jgi:hypothetical protein